MDENKIRELVARTMQGDTQAFNTLYEMTSQNVFFICISFMGNEPDAQDVMQETYVSAYMNLGQLQDGAKFSAWVSKIAINKCKQALSRKGTQTADYEEMAEVLPEENENFLPEEYIVHREKRKLIMDIMRKVLSPIQYQTVILYYFNGLKINEISSEMECPEGTVKYRLSLAKTRIKEAVLNYEMEHHDKLYAYGTLPFLASLLTAEAMDLEVPQIFPQIIEAITALFATGSVATGTIGGAAATTTSTSTAAGTASATTAAGTASATTATGTATAASTTTVSTTTAGTTAGKVAGTVAKTGLAAAKGKLIVGAAAAAVVISGTAVGVHMINKDKTPAPVTGSVIDIIQNEGDRVIYSDSVLDIHLLSTEYIYNDEKGKNELCLNCNIDNKTQKTYLAQAHMFSANEQHIGSIVDPYEEISVMEPGDNVYTFRLVGFNSEDESGFENISHMEAFIDWSDINYLDDNVPYEDKFLPAYTGSFGFDLEDPVSVYFEQDTWEGDPVVVYEDEEIRVISDGVFVQKDKYQPNDYNVWYQVYNKTDVPSLKICYIDDDGILQTSWLMSHSYEKFQGSYLAWEGDGPIDTETLDTIDFQVDLADMRKCNGYFPEQEGYPSAVIKSTGVFKITPTFVDIEED